MVSLVLVIVLQCRPRQFCVMICVLVCISEIIERMFLFVWFVQLLGDEEEDE